jgi:hypothetical protein
VRAAYYTVGRVCHYLLVAVALTIAVGLLGVDLSRFTLLVSAVGVGIGFGMQSLIGNFVSGLIILFERHLKVGDFVELESGVTGEVRAISIRATRITTNDNIDVLVPNSEFVNGRVVNWTFDDVSRRVRVKFGVSYRASKATVRDVVLAAAAAVPFTRDDPAYRPQVWLVGFGESSLDFELVVWLRPDAVKRPATVHAAYCWAIDDALREAASRFPFPSGTCTCARSSNSRAPRPCRWSGASKRRRRQNRRSRLPHRCPTTPWRKPCACPGSRSSPDEGAGRPRERSGFVGQELRDLPDRLAPDVGHAAARGRIAHHQQQVRHFVLRTLQDLVEEGHRTRRVRQRCQPGAMQGGDQQSGGDPGRFVRK